MVYPWYFWNCQRKYNYTRVPLTFFQMTQILQGLDIADTFLLSESPTQGGTLAFSQNSQKIFEKIRGGVFRGKGTDIKRNLH